MEKPTTRRYTREFKERAVRMVRHLAAETGTTHGTVGRVADQLGCGVESLRTWVRQDEVDRGEQPGVSSGDAERVRALEQENRELCRATATSTSPVASRSCSPAITDCSTC